jgi:hypothetical protein
MCPDATLQVHATNCSLHRPSVTEMLVLLSTSTQVLMAFNFVRGGGIHMEKYPIRMLALVMLARAMLLLKFAMYS